MLVGDNEDEQKETEINKNETTADASKELVREKEEENSMLNVEIQETETGGIGPETLKLFDIIANESDTRVAGKVTENSDYSVIQESESEIRKPPDILVNTA